MEKVRLNLVGLDGNALNLLGAFGRAARKQGWTEEGVKAVCDEATAGNYDHLLQTLMRNVVEPSDDAADLAEVPEQSRAQSIEELAGSFPSLRQAPLLPWDATEFDQWAAEDARSPMAFFAAQFVLEVWDAGVDWDCGPFDLMDAMFSWDEPHRAAFLAWAKAPWWQEPE